MTPQRSCLIQKNKVDLEQKGLLSMRCTVYLFLKESRFMNILLKYDDYDGQKRNNRRRTPYVKLELQDVGGGRKAGSVGRRPNYAYA